MSVINQMLKDLDRQGANASAPTGVIAVNQHAATLSRRPWLWLVLPGLLALAAAVWWFWPGATMPSVAIPAAPAPLAKPVENVPQLQLSQQLSPVPEPELVGRNSEAPSAVWRTPNTSSSPASLADNAFGSSALQSARHAAPRSAPPTAVTAPPATKPRLDMHLPEPRQSEIAKPTVVKEIKPLTPQAQAEESWRQASHLLEQGRNQAAQAQLENVLRLDPAHAGARQRLVALVQEAGDSAHAQALLREGLVLSPNDSWYARSLAQLHLQRGDSAQAAAILKTSLARHADAANWGLYASTLAKLGRPGDAAPAYREALRLNPAPGNWWIGLAVALEQSGERTDAGAAYQRALQTALSGELREFAQQKVGELGAR